MFAKKIGLDDKNTVYWKLVKFDPNWKKERLVIFCAEYVSHNIFKIEESDKPHVKRKRLNDEEKNVYLLIPEGRWGQHSG